MNQIVAVRGLSKSYGDLKAVDNIEFDVETGSLFAFLGPNGAGKSTTIEMLCTLLRADGGTVQIAGHQLGEDDKSIRQNIGVVFQQSVLDDMLTVRENLSIRACLYHLKRAQQRKVISRALQVVGAEAFADRRLRQLSGGQKRRADIARALLHEPRILFLDEPTTGLDPKTRESIWATIGQMQKEVGLTVFLTTHYMEEAAVADRIAIINKGAIVANATPAELKSQYAHDSVLLYGPDARVNVFLRRNRIPFIKSHGVLQVDLDSSAEIMMLLNALSPYVASFEVRRGNMDDVFLNIIGQESEHDSIN